MNIAAQITKMLSNCDSNLKAFATVTLDDQFAIKGVAVRDGKNGLFVSMPQQKFEGKDGKTHYSDIAFPTTSEGRKELNEAVLNAYEKQLQNEHGEIPPGEELPDFEV